MKSAVECPLNVRIGELTGHDLTNGFLETLASLAEVALTPRQAGEILRNRLRAGIRTYVARVGSQVIGTAALLLEQKFIHAGGWVGHIEDVAIHQEYQDQGIGTVLVRHATEEARRLGCYKVILNCYERLVPFYERQGYRKHDEGMRYDC